MMCAWVSHYFYAFEYQLSTLGKSTDKYPCPVGTHALGIFRSCCLRADSRLPRGFPLFNFFFFPFFVLFFFLFFFLPSSCLPPPANVSVRSRNLIGAESRLLSEQEFLSVLLLNATCFSLTVSI